MKPKRASMVRYISPFGSPAWMSRENAERLMAEDDKRWLDYMEAGNLSEAQRQIGAPRIELGP
jgi:hypothetical protein